MKLVHITQFFHPLKGYQENQFAKNHRKIFDEVYIITSEYTNIWGEISKNQLKIWDKEFEVSTGVKIIRLRTLPVLISGRVFCFGLSDALNKISPNYLYIHSISSPLTIITSYWINKYRIKNEVKTIVDDHMVFIASKNRLSSIFYRLLDLLFFSYFHNTFDKWIAVSEETKDFIIKKFNKRLSNEIDIIPLGVDLDKFQFSQTARNEFRNKFKIPTETKLLVYTGKRDNLKNPLILLYILKLLIDKGLNYKLLFVGENVNSYDLKIHKMIKNNPKIENNIIILPPIKNEELSSIYSAADCAIWPNQSSMSMLEAMACKCPVIASKIKVNLERLGNNRGRVFENGSEISLLNSILEIENNRQIIIDNAYYWVKDFDWEKLAYRSINIS